MDWQLAIEKNQEALKRILAMLVAMAGMAGEGSANERRRRQKTLPRHLHRFVLRLLRPAEAATRRLIIIAARGLVVKIRPHRPRKPKPVPEPKTIYVLDRVNGSIVSVPMVMPTPVRIPAPARPVSRSPAPSFPLFDPFKRFGVRRRYAKPSAMPSIRLLGDDDPIVPFFRRPEPAVPPPPPTPSPDDPLDAGNIHRRLDAIGRVLEDLPKQAQRMARWQARRDARWARERGEVDGSWRENTPSPSRPSGSPPLPHFMGARNGCQAGAPASPPRFLAPTHWGKGGEPEGRDGEGVNWDELGVTPEVLALCRRAKGRDAQSSITAEAAKPRRFHRVSPMRPGRPPGWRRKPNHDVYEVLNELHGLAVWARDRRDTS